MKKIIQWTRSASALLLGIAGLMTAFLPHTARLFLRHEPPGALSVAQAVAYAVAVEFAVIILVMRGNFVAGLAFAVLTSITNALYYRLIPEPGTDIFMWLATPAVAERMLFAVVAGVGLAFFSHEYAKEMAKEADEEGLNPQQQQEYSACAEYDPENPHKCGGSLGACKYCGTTVCRTHSGAHATHRCPARRNKMAQQQAPQEQDDALSALVIERISNNGAGNDA